MPGFSVLNNGPIVRNLAYMYICVCVFCRHPCVLEVFGDR